MKIYIKNMICPACKFFVQMEMDSLGIRYKRIDLGEVELIGYISENQMKKLDVALQFYGLELYKDRDKIASKAKSFSMI